MDADSILENTTISLITVDPGDEVYSLFGHSAIRIKNPNQDFDIVYNYGTFDFDTPNFTIKFMRGKLPYKLTAYNFDRFLEEYQYFKRGVREQKLNISTDQKRSIVAFLDMNIRPENAEYKYDFFFDNCSSRIRDVFERTLHVNPIYTSNVKLTLRDQLHQYQLSHPWTKLGIDMVIGSKADKNSDARQQMFLPDYLHDVLGNVEMNNEKLLQPSREILVFNEEKKLRNTKLFFGPLALNIILLSLALLFYFSKKENWLHYLTKTWYFIAGCGGVVIIFLWFFTDHIATQVNWNILWLNPLFFILLLKESKPRTIVKYILTVTSIIALLNSAFNYIPQQMPYLSCIVPAFFLFIWKEWLVPIMENKKSV